MLEPLPPSSWTAEAAAHLLSRAGFGGSPEEVEALHRLGLDAAVDRLLFGEEDADLFPPPAWTNDPRPAEVRLGLTRNSGPEERMRIQQQARAEERGQMMELRADWLARMRFSTFGLREKLTLFWHGHYATSVVKVQSPYKMWLQLETLRANALGNAGDLAKHISRDPAMIRWLDLNASSAAQPNENFARELMELFLLGEGNYSEDDIKQSARAFTGYRVRPLEARFVFQPRQHDTGVKEFMGRRGRYTGDDIIDIILERGECANFLAARIWGFLGYENPPDDLRAALGNELRRHRFELAPFLRTALRSREFYGPRAVRTQIKSPVQWLVQTCKQLEIDLPAQPALDGMLSQMGQIPFAPPNVRGWVGGRSWIGSSTLVFRYNLAGVLAGSAETNAPRLARFAAVATADPDGLAPDALRRDPESLASSLVFRLFGTRRDDRLRSGALAAIRRQISPPDDRAIREILHDLMSSPDFQLT